MKIQRAAIRRLEPTSRQAEALAAQGHAARTRFGPIAEREYDRAADVHKPTLAAWLDKLPTLSDADLFDQAASAIHGSALVSNSRRNWEHEHCKATSAHAEAERRHKAAGHSKDCHGDTIYSLAFAQVWREQGYRPSAYPPKPCDCGAKSAAA